MDEPQKKKRYEDDGYGTPGLRIGSVVHEYIATRVVTKKSGTVRVRLYRCALCPPADEVLMISTGVERGFHDEGRLAAHLAGHALRADVAHSKAMARECGMSSAIPGQTGMAELGDAEAETWTWDELVNGLERIERDEHDESHTT